MLLLTPKGLESRKESLPTATSRPQLGASLTWIPAFRPGLPRACDPGRAVEGELMLPLGVALLPSPAFPLHYTGTSARKLSLSSGLFLDIPEDSDFSP